MFHKFPNSNNNNNNSSNSNNLWLTDHGYLVFQAISRVLWHSSWMRLSPSHWVSQNSVRPRCWNGISMSVKERKTCQFKNNHVKHLTWTSSKLWNLEPSSGGICVLNHPDQELTGKLKGSEEEMHQILVSPSSAAKSAGWWSFWWKINGEQRTVVGMIFLQYWRSKMILILKICTIMQIQNVMKWCQSFYANAESFEVKPRISVAITGTQKTSEENHVLNLVWECVWDKTNCRP